MNCCKDYLKMSLFAFQDDLLCWLDMLADSDSRISSIFNVFAELRKIEETSKMSRDANGKRELTQIGRGSLLSSRGH